MVEALGSTVLDMMQPFPFPLAAAVKADNSGVGDLDHAIGLGDRLMEPAAGASGV
jgi:hypothetical protein